MRYCKTLIVSIFMCSNLNIITSQPIQSPPCLSLEALPNNRISCNSLIEADPEHERINFSTQHNVRIPRPLRSLRQNRASCPNPSDDDSEIVHNIQTQTTRQALEEQSPDTPRLHPFTTEQDADSFFSGQFRRPTFLTKRRSVIFPNADTDSNTDTDSNDLSNTNIIQQQITLQSSRTKQETDDFKRSIMVAGNLTAGATTTALLIHLCSQADKKPQTRGLLDLNASDITGAGSIAQGAGTVVKWIAIAIAACGGIYMIRKYYALIDARFEALQNQFESEKNLALARERTAWQERDRDFLKNIQEAIERQREELNKANAYYLQRVMGQTSAEIAESRDNILRILHPLMNSVRSINSDLQQHKSMYFRQIEPLVIGLRETTNVLRAAERPATRRNSDLQVLDDAVAAAELAARTAHPTAELPGAQEAQPQINDDPNAQVAAARTTEQNLQQAQREIEQQRREEEQRRIAQETEQRRNPLHAPESAPVIKVTAAYVPPQQSRENSCCACVVQ